MPTHTQVYSRNSGMQNAHMPQVLYDAMRQRLGGTADDAYFHRVSCSGPSSIPKSARQGKLVPVVSRL